MKDIRVIFMGTPDFSVSPLNYLIENSNVVAVVTKPDAIVGRKKVLTESPVKVVAKENSIPVITPSKLKEEYEDILKYEPDLIVTCAYGKIVPKVILDYPKYGCVNIHASLLPKYRGSAPIQWAIINGEAETGITLMYMDEGMDTGDIIDVAKIKIEDKDDVGTLHDKLSLLGTELLSKNFSNIVNSNVNRIKQDDSLATLAPMIKNDMENIDFNDYGKNIINKIRAFSPWPLTKCLVDNEEVKIIKANFKENKSEVNKIYMDKNSLGIGCIDGIIYLDTIKPIGKKEMDIKSYLNGKRI